MINNSIEAKLWKTIASKFLSVSHDHWHIDRVLSFANFLHSRHGGDLDVIIAATLLHDLGRSDPDNLHGEASRNSSIRQAEEILNSVNLTVEQKSRVIQAIQEHDQPDLSPNSLEGLILKEADFLAGFGAWGVLRIALWAGETKGGVSQILDRLQNRMPKRLNSLLFVESQQIARNETLMARMFLEHLRYQPPFEAFTHNGKYIVLEGVSGSGKDTQAQLLKKRLEKEGYSVVCISEPTEMYKNYRNAWALANNSDKELDDPVIMSHLLLADRYEQISKVVKPALANGKIVISIRSYISTLVYQCKNNWERAQVAFQHQFIPIPNLVLLYDVTPENAIYRIETRGRKTGIYETLDKITKLREAYLDIFDNNFYFIKSTKIDANHPIDEVQEITWEATKQLLSPKL